MLDPAHTILSSFGRSGPPARRLGPDRSAVHQNPWLRAVYERLRAAGKLPELALAAAMRRLLLAVCVTARTLQAFVICAE